MRYVLNHDMGEPCSVNKFNDDGSGLSIPLDPDNSDFCRYLVWLHRSDDGSLEDQALRSDMRERLVLVIAGIDPKRIEQYGREVP